MKVHDNEGPVVTVVDPEPCINGVDFDAEPYGEEDQTPGSGPFECDEAKTWTASATDCSDQSVITWEGKLMDANGKLLERQNTRINQGSNSIVLEMNHYPNGLYFISLTGDGIRITDRFIKQE